MSTTSKFLKNVKAHRESKKAKKFEGFLEEYLQILEEDPAIAALAHKRLYKQILGEGMITLDETDERCNKLFNGEAVKVYDYFDGQFFGMERPLEKVMRFLHSAAMRGEESRQVLLLLGPVGAGKSALIEHIKGALEACAPIYVLQGCPIREEPLHLIPRSLRDDFLEMYGIQIEGDLCPICRHTLINEYEGDYTKFPITQSSFSVRGRKGVGVVPPMDPNTQDTSLLIGSEDISKLDLYPEDDPRVLSLNGAFNVGNRGIVEFVEVFKNEIEFLHTMITATQEKNVPSPGKQAMIYFDGVIWLTATKQSGTNLSPSILTRLSSTVLYESIFPIA